MTIILRIICVYLLVAVCWLIYMWFCLKFDKKLKERWEDSIEQMIQEHPNINADTIYTMSMAHLARQCLLWPKLLYSYFSKGAKQNDKL